MTKIVTLNNVTAFYFYFLLMSENMNKPKKYQEDETLTYGDVSIMRVDESYIRFRFKMSESFQFSFGVMWGQIIEFLRSVVENESDEEFDKWFDKNIQPTILLIDDVVEDWNELLKNLSI